MKSIIIVCAAALAASVAHASPAEDAADTRCLLLAAELANDADPEVAEGALLMSQYYLGRIDGRRADADLEALMLREIGVMLAPDKEETITACSDQMVARSQALQAAGERIGQRAGG